MAPKPTAPFTTIFSNSVERPLSAFIIHQLQRIEDRDGPLYYTLPMAMGKRKSHREPRMWIATTDLPTAASHPFYARLNRLFAD